MQTVDCVLYERIITTFAHLSIYTLKTTASMMVNPFKSNGLRARIVIITLD
jgi:hypothetical protein